jgi:cystathionine beta-lyase/cystathionine gamma-synthase
MSKIFYSEYMTTGAGATPFHAWLLLRGLRTLPLRLQRVADSTARLWPWLKQQPWVEQLLFPGDPDFPQAGLARQQMSNAGGLLTLVLRAERVEQIEAFCNALQRFRMAVSWGGHESLLIPKCAGMPRQRFDAANPAHRQVRLYVGLEEPAVLQADLEQASRHLSDAI